jgi:hypothetical protein
MLTDEDLAAWAEQAKRDDWHQRFVGSDLRQLIGELQRLRAATEPFAKAAAVGICTYNAVAAADLYGNGVTTLIGISGYAGCHAAESRISWANWRQLAEVTAQAEPEPADA